MLHFELESDRDVLIDGIGLVTANTPMEVTEEMKHDFLIRNGVELVEANFPAFVKVTTIVAAPAE